ncbi:Hypothetical protein A7982_02518 [Minicystis rosea]|nr:Hypothetical protein A7982_02518 [Minicystis rosea]
MSSRRLGAHLMLLASTVLMACSSAESGGTGSTAGSGGGGGAAPALPIEAPKERWTWVPFADAFCANGESTGLAVNLTDRSKRVVFYLEGGGACWDESTCYTLKASSHIESGYGQAEFDADFDPEAPKVETAKIFDRSDAANPFKDMSFVYVPYCTGDLHGGDSVATYGDHTTRHAGGANVVAYLRRIVPTFPDAERVFFIGASAGAYGVTFNAWRVQKAFGDVRVDVIDDSGPPLDPPYFAKTLSDTWRKQWNLNASLPPDCAACKETFGALYDYYGKTFTTQRRALLSYTTDWILPIYFGFEEAQFPTIIDEIAEKRVDPYPAAHYFFADGKGHVLLTADTLPSTNGIALQTWLGQMVNDDPAWTSVHP